MDEEHKTKIGPEVVRLKAEMYKLKQLCEQVQHVATRNKLEVALQQAYNALDDVQAALAWGAYE